MLQPVDPEPVQSEVDGRGAYQITAIENAKEDDGLRWQQLGQLGMALYPSDSPHGKPTSFRLSRHFLIVGTYNSSLLVFNYTQQLAAQLTATDFAPTETSTALGPITAINASPDETRIVVGFASGFVAAVVLEKLPKHKLEVLTTIRPLEVSEIPAGNSIIERHETHVKGTPVVHCCFIEHPARERCAFYTLDASGLLVRHTHKRLLLEWVTLSRRVLGSFQKKVAILDADSCLDWNLTVLLTEDLLVALDSAASPPKVVLSIPRTKDMVVDPNGEGCVRLSKHSRQLIYSWGDQLKHLEFDKNNAFSVVSIYSHHTPITKLDWIGAGLVVLATKSNFSLVDLHGQQIIDSDARNGSPAPSCIEMETLDRSVFVLGKHAFSVGQFTNWADRLVGLLNAEKPVDAVRLALHYYGDDGELAVLGLPSNKHEKDTAVRSALPDLIMTALQYSLQFDENSLHELVPLSVRACVSAGLPMLESLMESVENNPVALEEYFKTLLQLVEKRAIAELPPVVFRAIVAKHPEPKLFYNLSLKTLDFDLAFKMCKLYPRALADVKTYLETQALGDFVGPLKEAVENKFDGTSSDCYAYLSMILTSRVFPTGEDMEPERALRAKLQVYRALFMDDNHELLSALMENDEPAFLGVLNLAFQDPWFNEEDAELNRQIIVNMLLRGTMSVPLAVFLARNYPKYQQFIVLSGSAAALVLKTLCDYRPKSNSRDATEEEQLAILSLLSVYTVKNNAQFIQQLIDARYMLVLEHVFRKQNKLLDLLAVQLRFEEGDVFETLAECMVKFPTDTLAFVAENRTKLMSSDPQKFGKLVARFNLRDIWKQETSNVEFLDAAYTELHRRGGEVPDAATNTSYIAALARLPDRQRVLWVLHNILTRESDIILPLIVDELIELKRIDVLAILLERKDRGSEALIYIVNYLPEISDDAKELRAYVDIACSLCQHAAKENRAEGFKMYERLLETLLELPNGDDELDRVVQIVSGSDVADIVQVVKYLLDYVTATADDAEYERNIEKRTRDRLEIINEFHAHIMNRERALRCFLSLIQQDGYQDLLNLMKHRAAGWVVPVDGECEVCGGKIVGLGINAQQLYSEWERLYKIRLAEKETSVFAESSTPPAAKHEKETAKSTNDETLVLFQCGHSYHFSCLSRMSPSRECVVCDA